MTHLDIMQMVEEMRSMNIPEKIIDIFVKEATRDD
jgi:hypothetical protein